MCLYFFLLKKLSHLVFGGESRNWFLFFPKIRFSTCNNKELILTRFSLTLSDEIQKFSCHPVFQCIENGFFFNVWKFIESVVKLRNFSASSIESASSWVYSYALRIPFGGRACPWFRRSGRTAIQVTRRRKLVFFCYIAAFKSLWKWKQQWYPISLSMR